jgi:hypothetical protein
MSFMISHDGGLWSSDFQDRQDKWGHGQAGSGAIYLAA